MRSLPVPVSPMISTGAGSGAARASCRAQRAHGGGVAGERVGDAGGRARRRRDRRPVPARRPAACRRRAGPSRSTSARGSPVARTPSTQVPLRLPRSTHGVRAVGGAGRDARVPARDRAVIDEQTVEARVASDGGLRVARARSVRRSSAGNTTCSIERAERSRPRARARAGDRGSGEAIRHALERSTHGESAATGLEPARQREAARVGGARRAVVAVRVVAGQHQRRADAGRGDRDAERDQAEVLDGLVLVEGVVGGGRACSLQTWVDPLKGSHTSLALIASVLACASASGPCD